MTDTTILENYLSTLWDKYPDDVKKTMTPKTKEEFIAQQLEIAQEADVMEDCDTLSQDEKDLIEQADKNISEVRFGDSRVDEETLKESIIISKKIGEREYFNSLSFTKGHDSIVIRKGTSSDVTIPIHVIAEFMKEFMNAYSRDTGKDENLLNTTTINW